MNNKKNSVLKSIVTIGFDKNGKIQSFVNNDRIKQILNNKENATALIKEVESLRKYVPAITTVIAKTKLVDVRKTVSAVKAKARSEKTPVLNRLQIGVIENYISNNQLLQAVKYVKESLNVSLKEAKQIVDDFPVIKTK